MTEAIAPSALGTRRGRLVLLLLCAVQFLDILDSSIVNVALPSIQRDLHFSQQGLQWVLSGYLVTYGGFLLLGGRSADLLGRRRILVAGTALFAVCSLVGGLAPSAGLLIAARLGQGVGAALMAPAGLSVLTTTFRDGRDRNLALGVWGAVSGLAAAAGVFFGGVLSSGPGWRWVLLVNPPICVLIIAATYALLARDRGRGRVADFDVLGAVLVTAGMLLLVYALVRAPLTGWGNAHTFGELATAGVLLVGFVINERRSANPLVPFSIFRITGLTAANATQLLAFAGFLSVFFFLTLYMQTILGYSPVRAGAAYLPVTVGIMIAAGVSARLFARTGTRPVIVVGALLAGAGMYVLSRAPADGSYVADVLPGLVIMAPGLGAVFVGVTTAANAGVPRGEAGLAAGLLNTSQQLGAALGLAIFSAIATGRTVGLLATGTATAEALTAGYNRALLACTVALLGAAVIALRTSAARGEAAANHPKSVTTQPLPDLLNGGRMKYIVQVFTVAATAELGRLPEPTRQSIFAEYEALSAAPGVLDAHQLAPGEHATTLRADSTGLVVTTGPFVDPREPLGGYYVFEADNLESVIEFASRIPAARMGGAVEIRPTIAP